MPPFRTDWAFFLDLDGTLFELQERPEEVQRRPEEVRLVSRLADASGGALALISGRSLAKIDELFAPLKPAAAGQHGAERRDAQGKLHAFRLPAEPMRRAAEAIRAYAERHEGLVFEDKGTSMALHYRLAPHLAEEARLVVEKAAAALGGMAEVQGGKMVAELKPAGLDKGRAIETFMREAPFAGRTPLFIGDDLTDEHGFRIVNRLGGHSVKVGSGTSIARWRLADPPAVRAWLAQGLEHATR